MRLGLGCFRVYNAESEMKLANSALKSRPKSKLFHGVNLGPMGYRYPTYLFMKEKTSLKIL